MALICGLTGCPGKPEATTPSASTPAAGGGTAAAGGSSAAAGSATISGKIKFDGAAPAAKEIDMSGVAECHAQHPTPAKSESLVVKDGGLQNVIVYVKEGATGTFTTPATAGLLDQKGCMYSPHVQVLQTGQVLEIKNSDPTLHNVHALAKTNTEFNQGMPTKDQVIKKKFQKPEIVKFKCDVHGWMNCYIGVFDHPYATVSTEGGSFELKNLPAGKYTIEAWHETLGTQTQEVTVGDKESKTLEFTFKQQS